MKKILSFSPFAEIWAHSAPESILLNGFAKNGYEIIQLRCRGQIIHNCTAMVANNINSTNSSESKNLICKNCLKKNRILFKEFQINSLDLEDLIDRSDLIEIDNYIQTNLNMEYRKLIYKEIPIGKYTIFEYMVDNKIHANNLKLENNEKLKSVIRNSMISLIATEKVMELFNPNYLIVFNSLYSMNRVVCAFAEKNNIIPYSIHSGNHHKIKYSQIQLYKWKKDPILLHRSKSWENFKEVELNKNQVEMVQNQILNYMAGKSVFTYSKSLSNSNEHEIYKKLGIKNDLEIVTALLSSEDEHNASVETGLFEKKEGTNLCFKNTVDWIKNLINYFAANPNLRLIIRVHPREFPNKREGVMSQNVNKLIELFSNLPTNVVINWPAQNISIYEIFKISKLVLNQTSSAGLEAAAIGVNTLVHDPQYLNAYPNEVGYTATSKSEYFTKILILLGQDLPIQKVKVAFKYIYFTSVYSAYNLSHQPIYNANPVMATNNKYFNILVKYLKFFYKKFKLNFYEMHKLKKYQGQLANFDSVIDTIEHSHDYYADNCLMNLSQPKYIKTSNEDINRAVKFLRDNIFRF